MKTKIKNLKINKLGDNRLSDGLPSEGWLDLDQDGELAVDVFQDKSNIYVVSTIAGAQPENLEISVYNDMLTISGVRQQSFKVAKADYFCQECFWGKFSRSIILPVEIKKEKISAEFGEGILTIKLPKIKINREIKIKIRN